MNQREFAHLDQYNMGSTAYLDYIGQHNPTLKGDEIYLRYSSSKFVDKALFGELTYHLTPAWQVTGGIRFFKQDYTNDVFNQLPLCGAPGQPCRKVRGRALRHETHAPNPYVVHGRCPRGMNTPA